MARARLNLTAFLAVIFTVATATAGAQSLNPSTTLTLPELSEVPVSPVTPGTSPGTLNSENTALNPITGLPCSGGGSLAVSGAGGLADAATPPPDEESGSVPTEQQPSLTSVFGSASTLGAC